MAGPYTFPMSAVMNFWNTIAETSLDRMQEISESLQKRRYQPSDILTDALGFYMDGINAWWTVVQQAVSGPVPYVFIRMKSDEESACDELITTRVGRSAVELTPLAPLGRGGEQSGTRTERVSADARWASDKRNCVVIDIHGVPHDEMRKGTRLRHGLYQASVHQDEKLLGIVQVLVED